MQNTFVSAPATLTIGRAWQPPSQSGKRSHA